jgi:hypothetical protein
MCLFSVDSHASKLTRPALRRSCFTCAVTWSSRVVSGALVCDLVLSRARPAPGSQNALRLVLSAGRLRAFEIPGSSELNLSQAIEIALLIRECSAALCLPEHLPQALEHRMLGLVPVPQALDEPLVDLGDTRWPSARAARYASPNAEKNWSPPARADARPPGARASAPRFVFARWKRRIVGVERGRW